MIQVKRKDNESSEALIRRFKKKVQQSGILYAARERRFYLRTKNKRKVKDDALRRKKIRKEKDLLRKLGKIQTNKKW
ncbi:30S ribosomal protein S21 [Patescibacteria group bacterium]|nr:30S ribosomal protein S21 [Patescibacteria group bacterium]